MFSTANGTLSAQIPEFEYKASLPRRSNASWFRVVERRIADSSIPDPNSPNRRLGLSQSTAIAALNFFKSTSDLLPGEPYMYGSPLGDLVAEFATEGGTLTSVIGSSFTLLFAVVDGRPVEKKISQEDSEIKLRSDLTELAQLLRTGRHGALDTGL